VMRSSNGSPTSFTLSEAARRPVPVSP
jgi:hypothetical protein